MVGEKTPELSVEKEKKKEKSHLSSPAKDSVGKKGSTRVQGTPIGEVKSVRVDTAKKQASSDFGLAVSKTPVKPSGLTLEGKSVVKETGSQQVAKKSSGE